MKSLGTTGILLNRGVNYAILTPKATLSHSRLDSIGTMWTTLRPSLYA